MCACAPTCMYVCIYSMYVCIYSMYVCAVCTYVQYVQYVQYVRTYVCMYVCMNECKNMYLFFIAFLKRSSNLGTLHICLSSLTFIKIGF